jgi:hypothetical protein
MRERDHGQCGGQCDGLRRGFRRADGVQRRGQEVLDGRLGDGAEAERAHGDPELGAGQCQRQFGGRRGGSPGGAAAAGRGPLQPGPPCGDQGELGDDEERVPGQQRHRGRECGQRVHGRLRRPSGPLRGAVARRMRTWRAT